MKYGIILLFIGITLLQFSMATIMFTETTLASIPLFKTGCWGDIILETKGTSMQPTIFEGDLVIAERDYGELKLGDIITYLSYTERKITHRIIEKIEYEEIVLYKMKGDNNNASEGYIKADQVMNKVICINEVEI